MSILENTFPQVTALECRATLYETEHLIRILLEVTHFFLFSFLFFGGVMGGGVLERGFLCVTISSGDPGIHSVEQTGL